MLVINMDHPYKRNQTLRNRKTNELLLALDGKEMYDRFLFEEPFRFINEEGQLVFFGFKEVRAIYNEFGQQIISDGVTLPDETLNDYPVYSLETIKKNLNEHARKFVQIISGSPKKTNFYFELYLGNFYDINECSDPINLNDVYWKEFEQHCDAVYNQLFDSWHHHLIRKDSPPNGWNTKLYRIGDRVFCRIKYEPDDGSQPWTDLRLVEIHPDLFKLAKDLNKTRIN